MFRPVLNEIMHTLNLNQNFPLDIVHGVCEVFGLEIDNMYHMQNVAKIRFFLGHTNMCDRTGELLHTALDHLELISGMGGAPFANPRKLMHPHIPDTWAKSLALYLIQIGSFIDMRRDPILQLQREQDQYIMRIALDGGYDLQLIQQSRL